MQLVCIQVLNMHACMHDHELCLANLHSSYLKQLKPSSVSLRHKFCSVMNSLTRLFCAQILVMCYSIAMGTVIQNAWVCP